jgi:hypothetical protein
MLIPLGILSGAVASAASYELISTQVLASTAASVTFSLTAGQQAAYKHLQLRMTAKTTSAEQWLWVQFNGDTGSNYSYHTLRGNGSTVASSSQASQTSSLFVLAGSNQFSGVVMDILDSFSTTKNKVHRTLGGYAPDGSAQEITLNSGGWFSTAAISSITLSMTGSQSYAIGSRFSLYGVRG